MSSSKPFRPMRAGDLKGDLGRVRWPLYASLKLDGIRCVVRDGVALSNTLKPIPNRHIAAALRRGAFEGLDGELIVGEPGGDPFRRTTSAVMSRDGEPDFTYWVFDSHAHPSRTYNERLLTAERAVRTGNDPRVVLLPQRLISSADEALVLEREVLAQGFEGLMLREGRCPYKYGRSTLTEQALLKLKRFADAEAEVLAVIERQTNTNPAHRNALGLLERSHHKDNRRPTGTLGAVRVRGLNGPYAGVEFEVGSGFTDEERAAFFKKPPRFIRYRYFPTGTKDLPRFPTFAGARSVHDLVPL